MSRNADSVDDQNPLDQVQSEIADHAATLVSYEILTYPADYTLEVLVDKWRKKQIVVPVFQRRFVWNQNQSSKLIDSFLKGLPVPPIFLFQDLKSQELLVVDGQQRVRTIASFFDGYFGEERAGRQSIFALKGLEKGNRYEGLTYSSMEDQDPVAFAALNNSVLRAMIIRQLEPADDTSVYHVFERLNTGGTQLTPQEIRNCVHHGPLNDMLIECNKFGPWRKIFGHQNPDKRQRDVELILRFLALTKNHDDYKSPMKGFLNNFMMQYGTKDSDYMDELACMFKKTASAVLDNLGEKPFHIRAGLNAAVFDSVFVAISRIKKEDYEDIQDKYEKLTSSEEFMKCVTASTTDENTVAKRLLLAFETLS
ncbi:MAG: DUF262 domain-containing protein [Acidimicrobiaceae bacterium]|nr:DUF262 domain-containing protein [Acidimicrobiaceae bacterium]